VLRVANDALDRTRSKLPALKEAGVVDGGRSGVLLLLEGALRFGPEQAVANDRVSAAPLRSARFTRRQSVGANHYCTEFVLENAHDRGPPAARRARKAR